MNILHLKYATEIERTGSINKAAESLYISQPNLSRAIKELESSLGIILFKRSVKGMVPTVEGEEFLAYAKKILSQIEKVENIYKSGKKKVQKFAVSVPRASYITEAFAIFSNKLDRNLPLEIFYMETNTMNTIKNLTEEDYKLGIIRYSLAYDERFKEMIAEKNLVHEVITEFRYLLLMNKNHPLANKESITYDDLKSYTQIAHGDPFVPSLSASVIRKEEMQYEVEKVIYVFERGSQFEILSHNEDTFMWVSPIPHALLEKFNLVQRECVDNKKMYRDTLLYKSDYKLSNLDNMFITELCNAKRKYL